MARVFKNQYVILIHILSFYFYNIESTNDVNSHYNVLKINDFKTLLMSHDPSTLNKGKARL